MASPSVALYLSSADDEALWRTALASQRIVASKFEVPGGALTDAGAAASGLGRVDALMVDLPALASRRLTLSKLALWTHSRWPHLKLVARLPSRPILSRPEEAWALANGAVALLPGQSRSAAASILPALRKVARAVGLEEVDATRLNDSLRAMGPIKEAPDPAAIGKTLSLLEWLAAGGTRLQDLSRKMQGPGGVPVQDRVYRGRTYRQCFVGSEAVAWLREKGHLNGKSPYSVAEAMGRTGLVHHVVREHLFTDADYFFRFGGLPDTLDAVDLDALSHDMRGSKGVPIGNRMHLGKTYESCFVVSDAIDWLTSRHRLTVGEAETVGQRLVDLGVIHHVVDEHDFVDSPFFFRFVTSE